jgi:heme exporter protein C
MNYMWWKILIFLAMSGVIVLAFATPSPMNPAYSLGPADAYRIFYFHVPQSWVASLAFLISMFFSVRFLQTKNMKFDLKAVTANRLGLIFAILAAITGSIFAKMTWGEFWNWSEIREVSIFILLIIYGAYFALRSALPDPDNRATLSAVLSIIFAVSAIFLIFILPRVYPTFSQHPYDSVMDKTGKLTMGPMVSLIFFTSLATFTALFLWIYNLSLKVFKAAEENLLEDI